MKFSELSPEQKTAYQELFAAAYQTRIQDQHQYTQTGFRLLILGNGAGIALLATFMGAVAGESGEFGQLIAPLAKIFLGCTLGCPRIHPPYFSRPAAQAVPPSP